MLVFLILFFGIIIYLMITLCFRNKDLYVTKEESEKLLDGHEFCMKVNGRNWTPRSIVCKFIQIDQGADGDMLSLSIIARNVSHQDLKNFKPNKGYPVRYESFAIVLSIQTDYITDNKLGTYNFGKLGCKLNESSFIGKRNKFFIHDYDVDSYVGKVELNKVDHVEWKQAGQCIGDKFLNLEGFFEFKLHSTKGEILNITAGFFKIKQIPIGYAG